MSNTIGKVIPDNPRKAERVPLLISSELKNNGKLNMEDVRTGIAPSDDRILSASVVATELLASSYLMQAPTAEHQGTKGSCMVFSAIYARSIEHYYRMGASSYSKSVNIFSPEYLYNQVKVGDCSSGSAMISSLETMKQQGVCLWNTMPYTLSDCSTLPNNSQRLEAANYKINYSALINSDRALIKQLISTNRAVMVGVSISQEFYDATSGYIWSNFSGLAGDHAVTLIGYDDTKNAYLALNSWGTSWATGGAIWIDYDFFPSVASYYLYTIENAYSPLAPLANAGPDLTAASGGTAHLDGTGSSDPDGYLVSYLWQQISGPNTSTITNSTSPVALVSSLIAGTYVYKLTVTDNGSNTAFDTVTLTVTQATAESVTLFTPTKTVIKGKTFDKLSWQIVLNNFPQNAELQINFIANNTTNFATFFVINPYTPQGSYSYNAGSKQRRYYRLKVVKSDGTIVYSTIQSIK